MRQIALVGCASTWAQAPWDDETWTIWAHCSCQPLLNPAQTARVSRWFDMHQVEVWRNGKAWYRGSGSYVDWLGTLTAPVMMQAHYPIVPTSVAYPLREIVETFSIVPADWQVTPDEPRWWHLVRKRGEFSSTFAYMMAFALYDGVDELGVYGIDFTAQEIERVHQRPGAKYWVGMARGLNVPVTIPPESLLQHQDWLYGYERRPDRQEIQAETPVPPVNDPMWFVPTVAHA